MKPRVDRLSDVRLHGGGEIGDAAACGRAAASAARLRGVYERTSAKLYGICLRVLGDEAEAQDVLQDIFTTVWRKAGRFDPAKASAITWLSVLARNKAIDRLRSRRASGGIARRSRGAAER